MAGVGSSGIGAVAYGLGSPDPEPAGGQLLFDPTTGQSTGSRRLDPTTKDYVLDQYGRVEGMSDVQQLVLIAVSTELGSSAVRQLGQELRSIDRITANFRRRAEDTLRSAVSHLVARNLIEVVGVAVVLGTSGRASIRFLWRDLTVASGFADQVTEVT